jgi:maleate cis-trans isomerase
MRGIEGLLASEARQWKVVAWEIGRSRGLPRFHTNRPWGHFWRASIGIVAMEGMHVDFKSIPDIPPDMITAFTRKKFAEHKDADAIWILGSALEALPLIAPLERALNVPVVQAIAARIWEIQKRLNVHEPIKGYGRLLETLPA